LDRLTEWIQDPENEKVFQEFVRSNALVELNNTNYDIEGARLRLAQHIKSRNNVFAKRRFAKMFRVAAMITISLGLGYYVFHEYTKQDAVFVIPETAITLQLEDGSVEIINTDGASQIVNKEGVLVGSQKGSQLFYAGDKKAERLVYNTLSVPYGKRIEVQLSDGTHVHLNAGSSLKYPVNFLKGHNREVFLFGEGYFDVSKDKAHPFIVSTNEMNVRVLGTQFNITSYPEDEFVNTVLVEGSVSVYSTDQIYDSKTSARLTPGYKAGWNKNSEKLHIEKVETSFYTAWVQGKISFKNMAFKNIRRKLERHYNVRIVNWDVALDEKRFSAVFDIETIADVMRTLNESYAIQFEIKDNEVVINSPKT